MARRFFIPALSLVAATAVVGGLSARQVGDDVDDIQVDISDLDSNESRVYSPSKVVHNTPYVPEISDCDAMQDFIAHEVAMERGNIVLLLVGMAMCASEFQDDVERDLSSDAFLSCNGGSVSFNFDSDTQPSVSCNLTLLAVPDPRGQQSCLFHYFGRVDGVDFTTFHGYNEVRDHMDDMPNARGFCDAMVGNYFYMKQAFSYLLTCDDDAGCYFASERQEVNPYLTLPGDDDFEASCDEDVVSQEDGLRIRF